MKRRVQEESTPLERVRENMAEWMSNLVDCGVCSRDTTAPVTPVNNVDAAGGGRNIGSRRNGMGMGMGPSSSAEQRTKDDLKKRGVGSLSFEETTERNGMDILQGLSFERSVQDSPRTHHGGRG